MNWVVKFKELNSYWRGVALMALGFLLSMGAFLLSYFFSVPFLSPLHYGGTLLMFVGMFFVGKYIFSREAVVENRKELDGLKSKQPWE